MFFSGSLQENCFLATRDNPKLSNSGLFLRKWTSLGILIPPTVSGLILEKPSLLDLLYINLHEAWSRTPFYLLVLTHFVSQSFLCRSFPNDSLVVLFPHLRIQRYHSSSFSTKRCVSLTAHQWLSTKNIVQQFLQQMLHTS